MPGLPKKSETYFSGNYLEETSAQQVYPPEAAGLWVSCPGDPTGGAQTVPQRLDGAVHLAKDYSQLKLTTLLTQKIQML